MSAEKKGNMGLINETEMHNIQLYFVHQEKCLLRIIYWKMNPTIPQVTKLTAFAGGIRFVPEKITLGRFWEMLTMNAIFTGYSRKA